jgi:hypothetical protein
MTTKPPGSKIASSQAIATTETVFLATSGFVEVIRQSLFSLPSVPIAQQSPGDIADCTPEI